MGSAWVPLEARGTDAAVGYEALHEDTPVWLRTTLLEWVRLAFLTYRRNEYTPSRSGCYAAVSRVREAQRLLRLDVRGSNAQNALTNLMSLLPDDETVMLNAIDLSLVREWRDAQDASVLEEALAQGGSAWKIATNSTGTRGLERRVDRP